MTVFLFAMMAEILAAAGISQAFARGMFDALGQGAVVVAPLSAAFGVLTNSGNMPNSLFMPAQTAIAVQAGLSVPAVAALQHVSGTAMSLFSPVRMSIAANLAEGRGEERKVYAALLLRAGRAGAVAADGAGDRAVAPALSGKPRTTPASPPRRQPR